MGGLTWSSRGAPADAERVAAAETELGRSIPAQLRDFPLQGDGAAGWFRARLACFLEEEVIRVEGAA